MAKKNESSLIGYDPLAWMNNAAEPTSLDEMVSQIEATPNETPDVTADSLAASAELSSKITLAAVQTIQNVVDLHEQLCQVVINAGDAIEIDASEVELCDTATLQLFVILKQEMLRLNRVLSFDFPSDKFSEAARLLGVSELLGLDKPAAGLF